MPKPLPLLPTCSLTDTFLALVEYADGTSERTEVVCLRCGTVAVHESLSEEGAWATTLVASGYRVCNLRDRDEAVLMARKLDELFHDALALPHKASVVALLPHWVRGWIRRCGQLRCYVEPPSPEPTDVFAEE